ncbi:MAG: ATP-dependent helicase [Dehalococcoidia bacterium]|nr:ATP-dependent helicase [Dehalococcoidia bacterium]
MLVLHASCCDDQLVVWSEAPAGEAKPRERRTPNPVLQRVTPLPYDAGSKSLLAALDTAGIVTPALKRRGAPGAVWLPTLRKVPVASSPLIAGPPRSQATPKVVPWQVSTYALRAAEVVTLLTRCGRQQLLAPGIVIGQDLAYWSRVLGFASSLVARQLFLPGVTRDINGYHARWTPAITGIDSERMATLAAAMPAVARAVTMERIVAPDLPAATVLEAFLALTVDYLVRSALTHEVGAAAPRRPKKRAASFDSVHDQWIHALRSGDDRLSGAAETLEQLAAQYREWARPVAVTTASPYRLCFRLEEPAIELAPGAEGDEEDLAAAAQRAAEEPWYVRYLLQASHDPSLIVPVPEVWEAQGHTAAVIQHDGADPREYLLASLGQAAGISPHIEASLHTAAPGGYALDLNGAHAFLSETALVLEQAGFGVMLPAWWTRKGTKLRLAARANVRSPAMQGGSGLALDEIIKFDWEVALGDTQLSLQDLQALAGLKAPLVQVRGQWVQLSAEEIQAALAFWQQRATGEGSVRELVRLGLGADGATGPLRFEGVSATGWIGELLAQLHGHDALETLTAPSGFSGTLRPYQERGYAWLAFLGRYGLGACLADDMGLGKTIQTLALIQRDWAADGRRPVLLICPTSVVGNWHQEAARFTPDLPVLVHHGPDRPQEQRFAAAADGHALIISSYPLLHRDLDSFKMVDWAGMVLDEAQNIKNPQTKQAQAARAVPARYRIALTGTPVENNVGDLWSIMEFLNPGFLGTQAAFKRTFFVPIQANRDPQAAERLKGVTGPLVLRRLKTDKAIIADLPEKREMKVYCTLTPEQASLYAAVLKDVDESLDETAGIQRRGMILATLTKLKQVCNHPAHFLGDNSAIPGRSGKLARLTEMLEEVLAVAERALIFTQFAELGAILQQHLQETFGREVLFLHGRVTKKRRDALIARFQDDRHGPPLFVLSLKAGGTGLNLTQANHVFHFDRWWNPAVENQATDRVFRIGQTKNVAVHKFLCAGTLEEKIDDMIERKQEVAAQVVGAGEHWLTRLSNDELRELLALRETAVVG